jgi:hypothetical protein
MLTTLKVDLLDIDHDPCSPIFRKTAPIHRALINSLPMDSDLSPVLTPFYYKKENLKQSDEQFSACRRSVKLLINMAKILSL